ncbi:MAG: peptide chain release factor N(5)-glutamine methyltransferase [Desulfovibrio sp.]|jgi:release factor glutamine methyltransferase|nr:peptide chain release factor N(5)-glutamine methyltransferase [Desulfovibrio sp.]
MLLRQCVREAGKRLAQAGVESPCLCAQLLVGRLLGINRLECIIDANRELTTDQLADLNQLLLRKIAGEPLAYLLGQKEFFSRAFHVTPDTLIPRPETELLVETALALLPGSCRLFFADIGTGSGCLGITLALERKLWRGLLLDISEKVLAVAKLNAQHLQAAPSLAYVRADMYGTPLKPCSCDFMVSNPPYIAEDDIAQVMDEVWRFEPHAALFSPHGGAAHLEAVVRLAAHALKINGTVIVEHGAEQGAKTRALFAAAGVFDGITTLRDPARLERCTYAVKHQARQHI